MRTERTIVVVSAVLVALLMWTQPAQGRYVNVFGGPTYDAATGTGLTGVSPFAVNNAGTAVGYALDYVGGSDMGYRAVRWDASGTAATELGNLGINSNGYSEGAGAIAVNDAGTAVGYAYTYVNGNNLGARAVRWDASGAAATELGNLGTNGSGDSSGASASAVNNAGTAVGWAYKYVNGVDVGCLAVRWDASGTAATELGNLGINSNGSTIARAFAMNDAGTAVGYARKHVNGNDMGDRAVRWDASSTVATELENLGTDIRGYARDYANAVNNAGTAVGYAFKYVGGSDMGYRAVRWDASSTVATELGNLGTDSGGYSQGATAEAVNSAGMAVGSAFKYVDGNAIGCRAVRWDASGTTATELGNLGTDSSGYTYAGACAVNNAGTAVGCAYKYLDGNNVGLHAAMWGDDGQVIDLNTLIDPAAGWTLTTADSISSDGWWIAGSGSYDPDGAGPLLAYDRMWVMQVPEPVTLSLLALGGLAILRRRKLA